MEGETILCVSTRDWDSMWRSNQQIISRVAAKNRVFYFEPGRTPGQTVAAEAARNLPHLFRLRTQQVHGNLILVPTPPSLPVARQLLPRSVLRITTPIIAKLNARMLILQMRRTMEAFNVSRPILWLFDPLHYHVVGKVGEKLSCYYNYDEFADFAPNVRVRKVLRDFDDRLCSQVDVVFASSNAQRERRIRLNPSTYFIPNGVDFEMINHALDADLELPEDLSGIPRPIIGFAGWLGYHIDVSLLCKLAEAYPDCSLVLVGPDELPKSVDSERLRRMSNVLFVGERHRSELPAYLKAFDVALMPWQLTGHIRSAYPLKLHEYLASGRSVVATALPELAPFRHVIRIAQTHEKFIGLVHDALEDDEPAMIEARVAVARDNTWDHRVATLSAILDRHLSA